MPQVGLLSYHKMLPLAQVSSGIHLAIPQFTKNYADSLDARLGSPCLVNGLVCTLPMLHLTLLQCARNLPSQGHPAWWIIWCSTQTACSSLLHGGPPSFMEVLPPSRKSSSATGHFVLPHSIWYFPLCYSSAWSLASTFSTCCCIILFLVYSSLFTVTAALRFHRYLVNRMMDLTGRGTVDGWTNGQMEGWADAWRSKA